MRCYINYNPDQQIPIGRTTNRGIYEDTPYITPSELLKYKTRLINADRTMSKSARYSYLINNPINNIVYITGLKMFNILKPANLKIV